jgi:XTP/dITP diphosphohydrolase
MSRLVFASRNRGKLVELRELVRGLALDVVSVDEVAADMPDVVEDGATFEANAIKKARAVALHTGLPALADDSGLEIDALDGAPGVFSARFGGEHGDDEQNNDKVLALLAGVPAERRTARFQSVLALSESIEFRNVPDGVQSTLIPLPRPGYLQDSWSTSTE